MTGPIHSKNSVSLYTVHDAVWKKGNIANTKHETNTNRGAIVCIHITYDAMFSFLQKKHLAISDNAWASHQY